jgi:hypothetical protein
MRRKTLVLFSVMVAGALLGSTAFAQTTSATVGVGGIFPPDTTFNEIPITGLQSGCGVEIEGNGSARGQFSVLLIGVSVGGQEQFITIEGRATGGVRTAPDIATFSGTCTVNLGDGTPPLPNVPFTATITTNADDQGALGLAIGLTTLPNAVVTSGSMTIR